jgi:hypothetical protein
VNEENMNTLRSVVAEKARLLGKDPDGDYLPEAEMPAFLKTSAWRSPQRVIFRRHEKGTEIEVMWGGALLGYFGFLIDPKQPLQNERHRKLTENVYFFY